MTILTPAPNPRTLLQPSTINAVLSLLSPTITQSLYLATICRQQTLSLIFRSYLLSLLLLRHGFLLSQLLLLQSFHLSRILLGQSFYASQILARRSWCVLPSLGKGAFWTARLVEQETRWLRKKLEYEFFVFILGGGNGIILMVFWPGWIVVGLGIWGVWWASG